MPELKTAATGNEVPGGNATVRAVRLHFSDVQCCRFLFSGQACRCLQAGDKGTADSPFENKESITVRALYLLRRIPHCCWICDAPMSRQWLSGPNRAHFLGGVIADGEDKIELGRVLLSKFIPTLAAKTVPGHMGSFELSERFRPDCA